MAEKYTSHYTVDFTDEKSVVIRGLERRDILSAIGPNGLTVFDQRPDRPRRYVIDGITGVDTTTVDGASILTVHTDGAPTTSERTVEWLDAHFQELNEARKLTEASLRRVWRNRA